MIPEVPPHNLDVEQATLGAMLMAKQAIAVVREKLVQDDFFDDRHQMLYATICELDDANKTADLITVTAELTRRREIQSVGGSAYLSRLVECVPAASRAREYADLVHDLSMRRCVRRAAQEIIAAIPECKNAEEVIDFATKAMFDASEKRENVEIQKSKKLAMGVLDSVAKAYERKSGISGLSTGFKSVDKTLLGLEKGCFYIVAGRPGMGKTAFALKLATNVAKAKHVAMFSLEMTGHELMMRAMSDEAQVHLFKMKTGYLANGDPEKLTEASEKISKWKLHTIDTPLISVQAIRSTCRRLKMKGELDLVVIDHLQIVSPGGAVKPSDNGVREMTYISKTLKALAKELNCPVIALSQLSRAVESRSVQIPRLSDLRESGSIEQDADVVMFLYREEYYSKEASVNKGLCDLLIEKNRNGSPGKVTLGFEAEYVRFYDLDTHEDQMEHGVIEEAPGLY